MIEIKNENDMQAFVIERTKETWDRDQKPYYLSTLGTEIKSQGVNYKTIIGQINLLHWVRETKFDKVKIIVDPQHHARIGWIPEDKEYSFTPTNTNICSGSDSRLEYLSNIKKI